MQHVDEGKRPYQPKGVLAEQRRRAGCVICGSGRAVGLEVGIVEAIVARMG